MRGRIRLSKAVLGLGLGLGLGLAGTASTAIGGDDSADSSRQASRASMWGHHHWMLGSGVCPKCAKLSQESGGAIPPAPAVMPMVGQPSQANASRRVYPGTPVLAGASVSVASRMLVTPPTTTTPPATNSAAVAADSAMPPGFAVVGEATPATEPEPIGVMRTDYRQGPAMSAPTAYAPGRATTWNGPSQPGRASTVDSTMGLIPPPTPQGGGRSHILRTLLFGRLNNNRRLDQMRAAHAAISYGDSSQPANDLPASMVYGR